MPIVKSDHTNGKYCPRCEAVRPLDDFNLNKRNIDGHARYCKEHERQIASEGYHKHAEQRRKARRARYAKQPQMTLFESTRPADGPRCACGKSMYSYEVKLGKCLKCQAARIRSGAYVQTPVMQAGD